MNLYFVSGLGADKRMFQKLKLGDEWMIHHVEWVAVRDDESLETYCHRLSEQIDRTKPFILIGLSFGGIVAIQLAKLFSPVQTVIISSFCFKKEVSNFYILLCKTRIFKLLPVRFFLKPNKIIFRMFGANSADEKDLLTQILLDTDAKFFRWAIYQLFSWEYEWIPVSFLHIHGTADKILHYRSNMAAIPVEGGEHLMVYSRAGEVSRILNDHLLKR
jgi:pimeloyl-ACP methyl ester carboxylesterase